MGRFSATRFDTASISVSNPGSLLQALHGAREHSGVVLGPGKNQRTLNTRDDVLGRLARGLCTESAAFQGGGEYPGPGGEIGLDL